MKEHFQLFWRRFNLPDGMMLAIFVYGGILYFIPKLTNPELRQIPLFYLMALGLTVVLMYALYWVFNWKSLLKR